MRLSDLGREGIDNSGSHQFADHIYKSNPSGRFVAGKIIDGLILKLPSSRSFKNRYIYSRDRIVEGVLNDKRKIVVSVPSGIPRDLIEAAKIIESKDRNIFKNVKFYCIDLNPEVLKLGKKMALDHNVHNIEFICGNISDLNIYPKTPDIISCLGFTEFISDESMLKFLLDSYGILNDKGIVITTSTIEHKLSAYLMNNLAELYAEYRNEDTMNKLLSKTDYKIRQMKRDQVGYQLLMELYK